MTRDEFRAQLPDLAHGELSAADRQVVDEYLAAHPEEANLVADLVVLAAGVGPTDEPPVPDLLPAVRARVAARLAAAGITATLEGTGPAVRGHRGDGVPRGARDSGGDRARRGVAGHSGKRGTTSAVEPGARGSAVAQHRRTGATQHSGRQRLGRRGTLVLAALAALLVYVAVDVIDHHRAFATALSRLAAAESVRIEGTVLAPGGQQVPLRMWLQRPHPTILRGGRNRYRIEVGAPGEAIVITGASGFQRLLVATGEQVYCRFKEYDWGPSAAKLAEDLRVPPLPPAGIPWAGFSRQDVGDLIRYTFTKKTRRGTGRNVIEVEREGRLLWRHRLEMRDGDDWVPVSDLTYAISTQPLPDSLFAVQPPAGYREVDAQDGNRWWFERSLSYERAPLWASSLRTASMTTDWELVAGATPFTDSTFTEVPQLAGGIWRFEADRRPLLEVLRALGNGFEARTDDPVLRERRVSFVLHYRHGLSPEQRLALAGRDLGVRAVFSDWVDSTNTDLTFTQDGSPLPPRMGFGHQPFRRIELDDGRVRYTATGITLRDLTSYLWWQATDWHPGGGIFFAAVPLDREDPADALVDADVVTDGTWLQNAAVLAERYGITYRAEESRFRTRFIEVSPRPR